MHIYICTQRDFEDKISLTTPDTYEKVPIVFPQVMPEKAPRCNILNVSEFILEINITETSFDDCHLFCIPLS